MKIGIFGGSFNPIHNGNIKIANEAIKKLNLDEIIFVPAYKSPFKKMKLADPIHRVNMIKIMLKDKMSISDFEIKRKSTSYTIETVKYFKNKYPNDEIFIIMGSDQLFKLHKWKKIDEIKKLSQIVIFKRTNKVNKTNIKKYSCLIMNNELYPESSSKFRNGDFSVIPKQIATYIGQNHLYIHDLIQGMINPKASKNAAYRAKHCINTAIAAAKYAKQIGYDPKNAYIAGAFHDITKLWSVEKHHNFLKKYKKEIPDYFLLHSLTGSIWIDKIYKINNKEIVNAIKVHTSLSVKLSTLDKIIYAADKLCEGRKYPDIQYDRKLIDNDFDVGFANLIEKSYNALIKLKRIEKGKTSAKIFERLINESNNSSR